MKRRRTDEVAADNCELGPIHVRAFKRAVGGGTAGALSMMSQVGALMWLRTTINYQYAHGTSLRETLRTLRSEGGIRRLYRGTSFALLQASLCVFGDTFANTGSLFLLNQTRESTRDLPLFVKTAIGSVLASAWRIVLMPVDTSKILLQTKGSLVAPMMHRFRTVGPVSALYAGSGSAFTSCFAAHLPWFFTYNAMLIHLPEFGQSRFAEMTRLGFIGISSSLVSSSIANFFKVLKVSKQVTAGVTYRELIVKDGVFALAVRGLPSRLLFNAIQGFVFSILWRYYEGVLEGAGRKLKSLKNKKNTAF